MDRVFRPTAKVLLVDEHDRVLFCGFDRTLPDVPPRCFAVGGALEPGEDAPAAAVREVFEETGLRIRDPGPVILTRGFEFEFEGSGYDQEEEYFLVRTRAFVPVAARWFATELATTTGHRWWSIAELRATTDTVYPENLADLLEQVLRQ